jgi:hypothetical protein
VGPSGQAAADGDEALGVSEVGVDGAGTEEAGGSGLLEDLAELGEGSGPGGRGGLRWVGKGRRSGGGGVGAGHRRVRTPGR